MNPANTPTESHVEIERKWQLSAWPNLTPIDEVITEQGYLCFTPSTVRIRRYLQTGASPPHIGEYVLTIKGPGKLSRTEVETPLTAQQYQTLSTLLIAPTAKKRLRYYQLSGGEVAECSLVDEGEPTSFFYAEIEFASEQEATSFTAPVWFGRELTFEPGHSMASYCASKQNL